MKQNFTVRQGALDGVEAFLSVAQHRSFRKAAAELAVTPSAISQAVRTLEARVGAALFMRTTRSVGLTEAGERFLLRAKPAFEELVAASEVARDLGQRPAGLLRLTVPRAVVPILLERLIASFCQAYPDVEVEVAASADAWRGRRRIGPCAGTRADRCRRGESGETRARAGTLRANGAGCVSLLSQPPSNDAETASLHRSREEPLGRYQQNPKSH
jgi:DNA-binding transcriptional LysR family regulator